MLDELKRRLLGRPFKPFRVVLRDGRTLDVTRQFQVGIGLTVFGYAEEPSGRLLQFPIADLISIEMIDPVSAA